MECAGRVCTKSMSTTGRESRTRGWWTYGGSVFGRVVYKQDFHVLCSTTCLLFWRVPTGARDEWMDESRDSTLERGDARARRESDGRRRGAKRLARARGATVCRVGARLGGVTNDANPHVIHRARIVVDGRRRRDDARRRETTRARDENARRERLQRTRARERIAGDEREIDDARFDSVSRPVVGEKNQETARRTFVRKWADYTRSIDGTGAVDSTRRGRWGR